MDILKHQYIVQTVTDVHYDEFAINDVLLTEEFSNKDVGGNSSNDASEFLEYIEELEDGVYG